MRGAPWGDEAIHLEIASSYWARNDAYKYILFFPACLFMILLSSCDSKENAVSKKDVVAYVNSEPIFAFELKRTMALRARQDPLFKLTPESEQEQLDVIIDRKLMIQEAVDLGMAREEKFVNTIRTFWEQTLIRDFIDEKKEEFADYLFATDDEINEYYRHLGERVTFKVFKSQDSKRIDETLANFQNHPDVAQPDWQTIGPVGYGDIDSAIIREVFDLPVGKIKKVEEAPYFYLVGVVSREGVSLKPLETLRPTIEKQVIALKEKRLFESWLKSKRTAADIKISNPSKP